MIFDPQKIVSLIVTQRSTVVQLLDEHDKSLVFTPRILKLCRTGSEAGIVQLAFMDDCLQVIESVLFSLNGSRAIDIASLHRFLQPVARLYAKKDKTLYSGFSELNPRDCESFLETHYTDGGPFGGANRRTKWSGFQLARNVDRLCLNGAAMVRYRAMFEAVISPLLDESESVFDVIELGGLWCAIQDSGGQANASEPPNNGVANHPPAETATLAMCDFGNPSVLFDVVTGPGCSPVVKLNSSHAAFQNGRALELLLQAWAEMESNAWDRRKQLLGDIRSDWGRVARDLLSESVESMSE